MRSVHKLVQMAVFGTDHMNWYANAKRDIAAAAIILDTDPDVFAQIMAVTSPRVSVTRNVKYAIMLSINPFRKPRGMLSVSWASYIHWLDTGEIRGQKTEPFSRALKGDHTAIPLDVWMCKALDIDQLSLRRQAVFTLATQRVAAVADYLGWWNCEAQAAIWATAVRNAGRNIPTVSATQLTLEMLR